MKQKHLFRSACCLFLIKNPHIFFCFKILHAILKKVNKHMDLTLLKISPKSYTVNADTIGESVVYLP